MTGGYRRIGDLPQVIPVFPLDGALLLPRGDLPLQIFEPRYLNMVDDVMAGDRIIGLVEAFESAVDEWRMRRRQPTPGETETTSLTAQPSRLGWQDAIRALELDDAVRRSVERRRAVSLDFQEATEEASFKGTMTLVGCGLLWLSLLLLILSVWMPQLGWLILPFIGVFMMLQVLRWVVPKTAGNDQQAKYDP